MGLPLSCNTPPRTDHTSCIFAAGCVTAPSFGGRATQYQPSRSLPFNSWMGVPSLPEIVGLLVGSAARTVMPIRTVVIRNGRVISLLYRHVLSTARLAALAV